MDIKQIPPDPAPKPEPRYLVELTETELEALILRMTLEDSFMRMRARQLVQDTVPGGVVAADYLADEILEALIWAHDRSRNSKWVRRV